VVQRLKHDFPDLHISVNGGISDYAIGVPASLADNVDGAMVGSLVLPRAVCTGAGRRAFFWTMTTYARTDFARNYVLEQLVALRPVAN
jgi:hypothetical protein